jgi:hypothetical protein
VNPVDVWEGVDTHEPVGRNRLVKLAIHILSIIANSAGCERAFSHMGLVQTAARSRLSVDKVRKTTIVGMDIKRSHIEAGLVQKRERREFKMPGTGNDADVTEFGDDEIEDVLDFDQLAEQLIEDAASNNVDEPDTDEEFPLPPLTIRLPLHAIQSALQTTPSAAPKIPLKSLFIFPEDSSAPSEMEYFWEGGIQNLDKEMEVYEALCSSQESAGDSGETGATAATTAAA